MPSVGWAAHTPPGPATRSGTWRFLSYRYERRTRWRPSTEAASICPAISSPPPAHGAHVSRLHALRSPRILRNAAAVPKRRRADPGLHAVPRLCQVAAIHVALRAHGRSQRSSKLREASPAVAQPVYDLSAPASADSDPTANTLVIALVSGASSSNSAYSTNRRPCVCPATGFCSCRCSPTTPLRPGPRPLSRRAARAVPPTGRFASARSLNAELRFSDCHCSFSSLGIRALIQAFPRKLLERGGGGSHLRRIAPPFPCLLSSTDRSRNTARPFQAVRRTRMYRLTQEAKKPGLRRLYIATTCPRSGQLLPLRNLTLRCAQRQGPRPLKQQPAWLMNGPPVQPIPSFRPCPGKPTRLQPGTKQMIPGNRPMTEAARPSSTAPPFPLKLRRPTPTLAPTMQQPSAHPSKQPRLAGRVFLRSPLPGPPTLQPVQMDPPLSTVLGHANPLWRRQAQTWK